MRVLNFAAIVAVCWLAGCAGSAALKPKIVSSSSRTVVVRAFEGIAMAQNLADAECAKYSRAARWASGKEVDFYFDCVN